MPVVRHLIRRLEQVVPVSAYLRPMRRFIAALALPLLVVALSALSYQLFVVPWMYAGHQVSQLAWLMLWGAIPLSLIVSGAVVEKTSSALWILLFVTIFRRGSAAVLAYFHAPGHLKLDIDDADFWTTWFVFELFLWLPGVAIGRLLGASIRREWRLKAESFSASSPERSHAAR